MAKRIVWSSEAELGYNNILLYWFHRNHSKKYPQKLSQKVNTKLDLLSRNPYLGKSTDQTNIRITTVEKYLILYRIEDEMIRIVSFVDGRRDFDL